MVVGKRILITALVSLAALTASSCSRYSGNPDGTKTKVLSMGIGESGQSLFHAGVAAASAVNNSGSGIHVSAETSKGSPADAKNVSEGKLDLAMISGKAAYDAWNGTGIFEGEEKKELYALAACYPEVSQWMALKDSGYTFVHELAGTAVSAGTAASETARASDAAFPAVGIDGNNTEIWQTGLSEGANALRENSVDAAHGFSTAPFEAFEVLASEQDTVLLQYTDEELQKILSADESLCEIRIPAGTYPGQEEPVKTFGIKVLLCAGAGMEEETAYEIAKAMDTESAAYAGGHRFMALMQDKEFLCNDLPIPLHPGAERYYREMGYLK